MSILNSILEKTLVIQDNFKALVLISLQREITALLSPEL